jgi:hypothetical protein
LVELGIELPTNLIDFVLQVVIDALTASVDFVHLLLKVLLSRIPLHLDAKLIDLIKNQHHLTLYCLMFNGTFQLTFFSFLATTAHQSHLSLHLVYLRLQFLESIQQSLQVSC